MDNYNFEDHEYKHLRTLSELSSECTLFLKRDNDDFPLNRKDVNRVGLYGNGVRHTLKGGTGSGNVEYHVFNNVEQAFENEGLIILSKDWLNAYDTLQKKRKKDFIKRVKTEAKELKMNASAYSVGMILEEGEYDFSNFIVRDEVSLYILSRTQGEGHDRKNIKGDYLLTDTEIRDISFLANNSKKFLLVLNAASPIDLSPILDKCKNILLLNYLGNLTSETLINIIFGRTYPSGKLPFTWDKLEAFPCYNEFGDINQTEYKEDIFVGYRYFVSKDIKPMFEFGYGLSYTNFEISFVSVKNIKDKISVTVSVKNIGNFKGKEVVQLYISKPSYLEFYNSKLELVSYLKTKELKPNEQTNITLEFRLSDFATFDASRDIYMLNKGVYTIFVGNSSINNKLVSSISLKDEIILSTVKHIDEPNLSIEIKGSANNNVAGKNNIELSKDDFSYSCIEYEQYKGSENDAISKLTNDELTLLSIGNIRGGLLGMIGDNCSSVMGGAGESCLKIPTIKENLIMADGPAGLRLSRDCIESKGKKYKISTDPLWEDLNNYLPKVFTLLVNNKKNARRKGTIYHQYTTSLPVGSALASSFNDQVLYACGVIAKEEMEKYGVDIWLAPGMNIMRNPLCGRNFEYYSEDPYVTTRCACAIINGVQMDSNKKVCIKHYLCNNQETNRFNSNSIVSIRALREIYLRPFMNVIKYASPFAVMSSYNLVNGVHSSESITFISNILRNECKFRGLIITDWRSTGDKGNPNSIHPGISASKELKAGINLVMPGNKKDIKDISEALKNGSLTREELINNCNIVYNLIKSVK